MTIPFSSVLQKQKSDFYQWAFSLDLKLVPILKWHQWIFLHVMVAFWLSVPWLIISKCTTIRSKQESIHLDRRSNKGLESTILTLPYWLIGYMYPLGARVPFEHMVRNVSNFSLLIFIGKWFKLSGWDPQHSLLQIMQDLFCLLATAPILQNKLLFEC